MKGAQTMYYGISEAARMAGVSEDTLRRYAETGVCTPLRDATSRRRLFSETDVAAARAHRDRTRPNSSPAAA